MSPISATHARRQFFVTRRTLLKPGFFDPVFVMSIPVPSIASFANGIAPIRKPARIFKPRIISLSIEDVDRESITNQNRENVSRPNVLQNSDGILRQIAIIVLVTDETRSRCLHK